MMLQSRRRFLQISAALAGALAVGTLGQRYLYPEAEVRVWRRGMDMGHRLRDGLRLPEVMPTYRVPVMIVGGGAAALAAAWYLTRHGHRSFWSAQGFERDGNAAAADYRGMSAPTGAHYLAPPAGVGEHIHVLLRDLGILQADGSYRETDLVYAPENRLFYQGKWQFNLLPENDADSRRFFAFIAQLKNLRGCDGLPVFAIPIVRASRDPQWLALDRQTFADWLDANRYVSPSLRWYLDYCCRDDYGQDSHAVSAYAGLHYFAGRGNNDDVVLTWPSGLAHLCGKMRQISQLVDAEHWPDAADAPISCDASAVAMREYGDRVEIVLRHNQHGDFVRVVAQNVICATPLYVAKRIVHRAQNYGFQHDLPEYAPWLVANFLFKGRLPEASGSLNGTAPDVPLAWDNVVHKGAGLGYVNAAHQTLAVAESEYGLFTAYRALNHAPPAVVRRELVYASDELLLAWASEDLRLVYGDALLRRMVQADLHVRAHAMAVPTVGYRTSPLLWHLQNHISRIVFAHSDLSGYSVFEEAVHWGVEAARRVLNWR